MKKEGTPEKKAKKDWIYNILIAVFAAVFLFSACRLGLIYYHYQVAADEYASLEKEYVSEVTTPDQEGTGALSASQSDETESEEYPDWNVDFDALTKTNSDVAGWLYVKSCGISYPIVHGKDNEYYLHHTFARKVNSSGAVFMDYANATDFSDLNTFVYGHNMKNGSMFGKLKQLYKDKTLLEEDPYFYIFTPDHKVNKYEIVSYYITTDDSDSYQMVSSEKNYAAYLNKIQRRSIGKMDVDTTGQKKIVTLSTCSGSSGGNQRFLVHGLLLQTYDLNSSN